MTISGDIMTIKIPGLTIEQLNKLHAFLDSDEARSKEKIHPMGCDHSFYCPLAWLRSSVYDAHYLHRTYTVEIHIYINIRLGDREKVKRDFITPFSLITHIYEILDMPEKEEIRESEKKERNL